MVSQEIPPETGWGGIGTYIGIVAPALARAGVEVDLLSVVKGQSASTKEIDGITVHRRPLRRPPGLGRLTKLPETWSRLSLAWAVSTEARRLGRFDVIEAPEWGAEGLRLALKDSVPLVVRLHSGAAQIFPYLGELGLDRRLAIRLEARAIRSADIVTGTRSQIATVASRLGLPQDRVRVITYPVKPQEPLPFVSNSARILFAGRFELRKGLQTLVEAAPHLLKRIPEAQLVFLGRDTAAPGIPSMKEWLAKRAAALGAGHAIEFVEKWGTQHVLDELKSSAICAVPSLWESFGYVAAEAGGAGRPVLASRIPSLEDVVVDGVTGRFADPSDPQEWADTLIEMLESREGLEQMGLAAAQHIAKTCDPDKVAELTIEAHEAAISIYRGRNRVTS